MTYSTTLSCDKKKILDLLCIEIQKKKKNMSKNKLDKKTKKIH